jgi:hypothetical protein
MIQEPIYLKAVTRNPPICIAKPPNPGEILYDDDRLCKIALRRMPELGDAPHALAPGLQRYHEHPLRAFVNEWKLWLEQGYEEERAYQRALTASWRQTVVDKLMCDQQAAQARDFGVPMPDVELKTDAVDREMSTVVQSMIDKLERDRFSRLEVFARKRIVALRKALAEQKVVELPRADDEEAQRNTDDDDRQKEEEEEEEEEEQTTDDEEEDDDEKKDNDGEKEEEGQATDDEYDFDEHESVDGDAPSRQNQSTSWPKKQAAAGENFVSNDLILATASSARVIEGEEVSAIMNDHQWIKFRDAHPELRPAFNPIVWVTTPTLAAELRDTFPSFDRFLQSHHDEIVSIYGNALGSAGERVDDGEGDTAAAPSSPLDAPPDMQDMPAQMFDSMIALIEKVPAPAGDDSSIDPDAWEQSKAIAASKLRELHGQLNNVSQAQQFLRNTTLSNLSNAAAQPKDDDPNRQFQKK